MTDSEGFSDVFWSLCWGEQFAVQFKFRNSVIFIPTDFPKIIEQHHKNTRNCQQIGCLRI